MASSISVGEVYEIISKTVAPAGRVIELPLDEANGKFLAECVTSPTPVPLFNNSAMDGYAFNSAILETCADKCRLLVKGASYAGTPPDQTIDPQAALKVMTGAYVPSAYDTVIPYEKVNAYDENDQNFIEFSVCDIKPKVNLRLKGEEIAAGDTVLMAGTRLGAAEIGLAAALGRSHLKCRVLRAAVFATGDELTPPGEQLRAGGIYDANSHLVTASLRAWGVEVHNLGILPDDPQALRTAIRNAASNCDFLVTSGGVGESERDFTTSVLSELGELSHYAIRMRPGKPFSLGVLRTQEKSTYFVALPGNPVAAAMSAKLFLREAVYHAAGSAAPCLCVSAKAAAPIKGRKGRTDFVRGTLAMEKDELVFHATKSQSSAMLTTLVGKNGAAVLNEESAGVEAGSIIKVFVLPD